LEKSLKVTAIVGSSQAFGRCETKHEGSFLYGTAVSRTVLWA
jgi:hypothetical protein